jgi:2-polyprenyl-6-methoxyphenol hydroxylase-like FAD-dependent oxidoreductase
VKVAGLLAGTSVIDSVPHVIGVRTDAGEELIADLVVDVSGRQSRASEWLRALGARPPHEEQEDCGFVYYTRYFHGRQPERRAGALMPIGTISMLTLPGDNETWSVTVFTAAGDQPLKNLRHEDKWTATVRACPLHAHWLDGEPLTGVLPMSGIVDRYRRFVVDGVPVATGFAAVADAWACTNPSAGRGLTVGFLHAVQLRDALRAARGDHRQFAIDFDERTERAIAPWYRAQIAVDRARFAEMDALREGRQPPAPQGLAAAVLGLFAGGFADPDLFRALLEYICTLTPVQTVLGRPAVAARLAAVREAMKDAPPPRPMAGPSREQLLALVG